MKKKHFRSIFISDSHFGYSISRADLLANFLEHHSCDNLYLVGDIIDFWIIEKKWFWSLDTSAAFGEIINKLRSGANVFYITGNHDEVVRRFLDRIKIEGVEIANEVEHRGVDGKKYLVVHGDMFDNETQIWSVISHIGNNAYLLSLYVNKWINKIREFLNLEPWSISLYLKQHVKRVVNYINDFERHMTMYCKKGNYDGAICGHIHHAHIRDIGELIYMNCGDWVESCTALVENDDGKFEIITWDKKKPIPKNGRLS